MGNKVEILVEVDKAGQGPAGIDRNVKQLENFGKVAVKTGETSRNALGGIASGLGIPLSLGAITAGFVALGIESKNAYLESANANRVLKTDAQDAGISLAAAKAEAKAFSDELALSIPKGTEAFSKFLRLIRTAGDTKNLDVDRRKFEDLVSAYALTAQEIESISQDLEAGRAISLKRLGADPTGALREAAKLQHETVADLSIEEKARVRVNALLEIGAKNQGAAAERLASEVGQWQQLTKAIEDAKVNLGAFLLANGGGQAPGIIEAITKNPVGAAIAAVDPIEILNSIQHEKDLQADVQLRARNAQRKKEADDLVASQEAILNGTAAKAAIKKAAKDQANLYVKSFKGIFKDGGKLDTVTAIFAEKQFNAIKNSIDPEKQKEIANKLASFWNDYAKTALNALKTARDAAEKNLSTLAEHSAGNNNPFVKILIDADERAKELRKTFGVLKDSVVDAMIRAEESYTRQKLLGVQLDQDLKANALRREAANLQGFNGVSGAEQRKLDQINTQVAAAESIPELLAKAEAISKGLVKLQEGQVDENGLRKNPNEPLKFQLGTDQKKIQDDIFDRLSRINNGGLTGQAGRQAKDAINSSLVNLFNSLAPELQARIARGQEGLGKQATFAGAFQGKADSFQQAIQDEIDKAKVADRAVAAVQEDIRTIKAAQDKGLDPREADARLLATTGALSPSEQTADIRQARIEALRREADRTTKAQEDANKSVEEAKTATENLTKSIDALAAETRKPENRKLLVEITNRAKADVRAELYGSLKEQ